MLIITVIADSEASAEREIAILLPEFDLKDWHENGANFQYEKVERTHCTLTKTSDG